MTSLSPALLAVLVLATACSRMPPGAEPDQPAQPPAAAARIEVGPNVLVSTGHSDEAHYETHAAAHPTDPNRIVATAIIYPNQGRRGAVVYTSTDAGRTWRETLGLPGLENNGDPAVGFGPDGTAYYSGLTLRGHPAEEKIANPAHNWDGRKVMVYRSVDGGLAWEGPAMFDFMDRQYFAFDDTRGPHHGRVYVTGDPRPRRGFEVFWSDDGGRTFPHPGTEADLPGASIGNGVVASDGSLLGVFAGAEQGVRVARSNDGGATFQPSVRVDRFVMAGSRKDRNHKNVNHFLNMAIDRSGGVYNDRVYLTWPDRRNGRSEVLLSWSADLGQTWSTTRAVVDRPVADTTDQFMPTLAVNQDGVVGLLFYDRRDNPDNSSYYPRFQASLDGGVTWLPSVRLSETMFSAGEVAKRSAFSANGGDTAGLAVTADGTFHPVWVTDRNGIPQVWTARVVVSK